MSICVSQLQVIISIAKDVVTLLSLCVGVYVAVRGLQTWRRQLQGTAEYELGRRILRAAYRLRNAIEAVRDPLVWPGEQAVAMKEAGIEMGFHDPKYHAQSSRAVYQRRWQGVTEALSELEVEAIEAETLWGSNARDLIEEIKRSASSLSGALNMYIRNLDEPGGDFLPPDKYKDVQATVFAMGAKEDDAFASALQDRISRLEEFIRPRISIQS